MQEEQNKQIPFLVREKERKNKATENRIRPSSDYPFYGVTKTVRGEPTLSMALKIILKDGRQFAFNYHELVSPIEYDGASEISIQTLSKTITIEGRNLEQLFDYILEHRLVWMKEPDSSLVIANDNEVQISAISVKAVG
jgi:hypothetical protein